MTRAVYHLLNNTHQNLNSVKEIALCLSVDAQAVDDIKIRPYLDLQVSTRDKVERPAKVTLAGR